MEILFPPTVDYKNHPVCKNQSAKLCLLYPQSYVCIMIIYDLNFRFSLLTTPKTHGHGLV